VEFPIVTGYLMRARLPAILAVLGVSIAAGAAARAQTGPVIVVPGKVGVPVTINGMIVDGAIVYGDWGLARPGHGELIIEGPIAFAAPAWSPGYFPSTGHAPRVGRQEVEPPQKRRPVNTNYHREWSSQSDTTRPVTEYPPFDPPPVILAPRERRR
jgi:hypothetical protein